MRFLLIAVCCLSVGMAWAGPKCLDIGPFLEQYDSDAEAREGFQKLKDGIRDFFISRGMEEIPSVMEHPDAEDLAHYLQHKGFDVIPVEQDGQLGQNLLGVGAGVGTGIGTAIGIFLGAGYIVHYSRSLFLKKLLYWITLDMPIIELIYSLGIPATAGYFVGDEVATRRCDLRGLIP